MSQWKHKKSGFSYAVKKLSNKNVIYKKMFINEIKLMRNLDHPNIISAIEIYTTNKEILLIMHLCTGGNLYELISSGVRFTEIEALN